MSKMEKEPLFSAKNLKYLTGPFSANNPVIVQILGICSALAVTVQLKPAIVMALSVTVVTAFSNLVMSLLRNGVPSRIRIIVQLVVIAALVILVDQVLKAFVYEALAVRPISDEGRRSRSWHLRSWDGTLPLWLERTSHRCFFKRGTYPFPRR